ncbi:MAG: sugar phosphate isomerase/epimerase [Thermoleophilaceae bacterium]|nr:sugar phosphate isomerase/epimerase [Thermoleophilaceae bacterium]
MTVGRIDQSHDAGDQTQLTIGERTQRGLGAPVRRPHNAAGPESQEDCVELALMSASMLDRPWEAMLDAAVSRGVRQIEACAGGHIPTHHYDPVRLAADGDALERFRATLEDRELRLCSFSCHGNPLHPDPGRAAADHEDFIATCRLASRLGVRFVSLLAGLPAGGPHDVTPNWLINSAFPGLSEPYAWQWQERVLPYWREAAKIADDHGVLLCIEPHSADVVYNTPTFMRLRAEIGPTIAMNFDPSHLWWQGIDPIAVIETAGDAIATCHVKDALLNDARIARDGALSPMSYDRWDERPWTFSTPGYGHSELFWGRLVMALRRVDYSGTLSIECEDPFLAPDDTLAASVALLSRMLPREAAPGVDWASRVAFKEDVSGLSAGN